MSQVQCQSLYYILVQKILGTNMGKKYFIFHDLLLNQLQSSHFSFCLFYHDLFTFPGLDVFNLCVFIMMANRISISQEMSTKDE